MNPICSNTVFNVSNLDESIRFYIDTLGFKLDFQYGEPYFYAGLSYGPVNLHISTKYPLRDNTGHGHLYITCDEVDNYYEVLVKKGVRIVSPLGDQPYGLKDFSITDPDGNMLGFGASNINDVL